MAETRNALGMTEEEFHEYAGLTVGGKPAVDMVTAERIAGQSFSRITGEPYPTWKIRVSFPDGAHKMVGGQRARRASHVIVVHHRPVDDPLANVTELWAEKWAGTWEVFSTVSRPDLIEAQIKQAWKMAGWINAAAAVEVQG